MDQDELADVVQQRGHHQAVAGVVADLARQPVGGALGGDGVQPEALGDPLPHRGALKEVKRARAAGDGVHGPGREHLDAGDGAVDAAGHRPLDLVGQADHGDRQGDVALDRGDDVGGRRLAVLEQPQHAVAGLDQHRKRLQRLKRGGQPAAVALVVVTLPRRIWVGRCGFHSRKGRHGWLTYPSPPANRAVCVAVDRQSAAIRLSIGR